MVSERQRLARKRFREEHPELPRPGPTPPNPNKKKKEKRKSSFKRKKVDSTKRAFGKHPLRVPGMKPGDSCFICKAKNHIAKLCPEKDEWEKNKICLFCRQRGHSLKRCPRKNDETSNSKMCYNCGESGHSLANCPQPLQDGGTKFASCFICKKQGHISKDCPQNTHGIYPKGGCCKICCGVTHLARDCPEKGNRSSAAPSASFYYDERPRGQVTKLTSGDDLEDDFMTEEKISGDKNKSSKAKLSDPASDSKDIPVKQKKKQGPKVVNFVG